MVHIQNVDLKNIESQNVELQNVEWQNVDGNKTSTSQNVDTTKRRKQNVDTILFKILLANRNRQFFLRNVC
jgi:hypothetical protein